MQMITQLKIKKELIIMLNSILLILAAVIPAVLLLVKVYRTDLNGAVGIDIKRNGLKADIMRPEKNARMSGITDFYS